MKLTIDKVYDPQLKNFPKPEFHCADENGKSHIVDVWVDGALPEELNRHNLIGETIEVDYLHPYSEIAVNPRLVAQPSRESDDKN